MKLLLKNKLLAQAAIVNAAVTATRAMTAEEKTSYDSLEIEIKNLELTIEAQAKQEEREIKAKTPVNEPIYAEVNTHKPIWSSFGEQLNAVRNASMAGATIDNRLLIKNAASGASEGVMSDGGFLVGTDFTQELLKKTYETGVLPAMCRKIPISQGSNGLKILTVDETSRATGSRWGGINTYWEGEADTLSGSKPKFGQLELRLKKLTGLCYATDELLSDTTALEAIISQAFAEEFGFRLDDSIVRGSGAGQPLGFLNSPALITVSKTASQTADTISFNNVLNMKARMIPRSFLNSVWLINSECEDQLTRMILPTGTASGQSLYIPANGISATPYSTLFGRPVMVIEQSSALGDVGDISLCDFSQYMLIDKGGLNSASSVHVRFLNDESVFRFIYRVDGQPTMKQALTPYKGASTQSAFVTLAERA